MAGASRQALPLKEIGAINQMFCLIQKLTEVISRLLQLSYILDFPGHQRIWTSILTCHHRRQGRNSMTDCVCIS